MYNNGPEPAIPQITQKCLTYMPNFHTDYVERLCENGVSKIDEISRLLQEDKRGALVIAKGQLALVGFGGVGKSTLAISFAQYHLREGTYEVIRWLESDNDQISKSIKALSNDLDITVESCKNPQGAIDETKIIEQVYQKLKTIPSWLLIFDNVESYERLKPYLPKVYLNSHQHILITSRNRLGWNKSIEIGLFTYREAITYIQHYLPQESEKQARLLSKKLGRLPLALAHAVFYIKEKKHIRVYDIHQYLDDYEKEGLKIFDSSSFTEKFDIPSVLVTWSLSMSEIEKKSTNAYRVLRYCAFLHPDKIPNLIFERLLGSKKAMDEAYEILQSYSMIDKELLGEEIKIHRLVQEVIQHKLKKDASVFTIFVHDELYILFQIIKEIYPLKKNQVTDYALISQLLPHMLKLSELLFLKYNEEIAFLINYISDAFESLGEYEKSRQYLEKILIIKEKYYGKEHVEYATTLEQLGNIYGALGAYKQAQDYLEQALKIKKECYVSSPINITRTLNSLANIYGALGKYEIKREYLEKVLVTKEEYYGKEHVEYAWTMVNLGHVYRDLGEYKRAYKYLKEALVLFDKHYDKKSIDYAWILVILGNVYRDLGEYEQAREHLEQALIIAKEHFSTEHVEYAWTLTSLASVYKDLGEYEQAREYLEQALKINKKFYGNNHAEYARTLIGLGNVYRDLEEYKQSREHLEQALIIVKEHFGTEHVEYAWTLTSLANVYRNLGEYEQACQYLKKALIINEKFYGKEHVEYAWNLASLGSVYANLKEYKHAYKYLEQALRISENFYQKPNNFIVYILQFFNETLINLDLIEEALIETQKAISLIRQLPGNINPKLINFLLILAEIAFKQNNSKLMKDNITEALQLSEKIQWKFDLQHAKCLYLKGKLHLICKEKREAQNCFEQAYKLQINILGENHTDSMKIAYELNKLAHRNGISFWCKQSNIIIGSIFVVSLGSAIAFANSEKISELLFVK